MDSHCTGHRLKPVLRKTQFLNLLFLVYIKDFTRALMSYVKLFADGTSFFSVSRGPILTTETLNEDLSKVSQWAHEIENTV